MSVKKRVNGEWVDAPYYVYKTITDTSTELPADIIANGNKAAVGLKGNIEQQTYSGKNLFDGEIQQGGLGDDNGYITTSSARVRTTKINVLENTTYTISSNLMIRNAIVYQDGVFVARVYNGTQASETFASFTVPAGANQIAAAFKGNVAGSIDITPDDISEVQLELGSTATSYEPYVGGIPSPNPDYPQEVKGCGERTGNLFNGEIQQGGITDMNGAFVSAVARIRTNLLSVIPNKIYSVSSNLRIRNIISYKDGVFIARLSDANYGYNYTITIPDEANQIALSFMPNSADVTTLTPNDLEWLMLNSGSTPLPYEPYGYKVDVVTRGKNLINIIPFKATFGTGSAVIRDFLNSLDVGAYVVSYNTELLTRNDTTDNSVYGIRVLNESGNFELTPNWGSASVGTIKKVSLKITITEDNKGKFTNVYFYGCGIFSVGVTGSANISNFQLEAGTKATEYSPYIEPITTPIYLDSPLYKIGDYSDSRGKTEEVRAIKELVLTGEEGWQRDNTSESLFYHFDSVIKTNNMLCTHLPILTTYPKTSIGIFKASNGALYVNFGTTVNTVGGLKTYLAAQHAAGTPVKVYYVLSTPEINTVEPVEIPTLSGTTVIDVTTSVKPSEISLDYTGWHPMVVHKRMNGTWT